MIKCEYVMAIFIKHCEFINKFLKFIADFN